MEKFNLSPSLFKLAQAFKKQNCTLYVVGGYIRNTILNIDVTDVDLCGDMLPDDVIKLSGGCGFRSQIVNKTLGTVLLTNESGEQFEYTTFRSENYESGHTPTNVCFVKNIKQDAKRRDFTCNAIYLNILTNEITDFYNGISHVKRGIIKTVETPNYVFASDGLRILRLIRFACTYNFKVENKTMQGAKKFAYNLNDISSERKITEIKSILKCGEICGAKNVHIKAVKLFNKLNIWQYICPALKNFKLNQNLKAFKIFKNAKIENRFVVLFACVLLQKAGKCLNKENIAFLANTMFHTKQLRFSNSEIAEIIKLCYIVSGFLKSKTKQQFKEVILMAQDNFCFELLEFVNKNKFSKVKQVLNEMKKNNVPLNLRSLNVTAQDIINLNMFENSKLGIIFAKVFENCVYGNLKNEKEAILEYIKNEEF